MRGHHFWQKTLKVLMLQPTWGICGLRDDVFFFFPSFFFLNNKDINHSFQTADSADVFQQATNEVTELSASLSGSKEDKASGPSNKWIPHSGPALNLAGWQAAIWETLWQRYINMCHPDRPGLRLVYLFALFKNLLELISLMDSDF